MIDKLKLYSGDYYKISDHISIYQPTIGEIIDYGEREFYVMAFAFCTQPGDMKWQLWDQGIDWTEVKDWELFSTYLVKTLDKKSTSILFGDIIDFSEMKLEFDEDKNVDVLKQHVVEILDEDENVEINEDKGFLNRFLKGFFKKKNDDDKEIKTLEYDIVIDPFIYKNMCEVLRETYGFSINKDKPGNQATKEIQIDLDRSDYIVAAKKPYHSNLFNYVSTLVNSEGFKHDEKTVMDMKIYPFMDSLKRISKIKNANLLLQSGYSGFGISLKEINKKELDWMGDLK